MADHLLVFAIFQRLCKKGSRINSFKIIRCRTPEVIAALSEDLKNQNWREVYVNRSRYNQPAP